MRCFSAVSPDSARWSASRSWFIGDAPRARFHGDNAQRQDDVRRPRRGDRPWSLDDAAQRRCRLRGAQLPGDGRAVVSVAVRPSARRGRRWRKLPSRSSCTPSSDSCCSPSGRSPGSCTRSLHPCTTCSVRTSSTAPATSGPAPPHEPTVVDGNRSGREIARNHDHHEAADDRRHAQPRAGHVGIRRRVLGLEHHRSTRWVVPRRPRSEFDAELDPGGDAGPRRISRSYTGRGSHRPLRRQADVRSPVVPVDYPGAARHARGKRGLVRRAARRRICPRHRRNVVRRGHPVRECVVRAAAPRQGNRHLRCGNGRYGTVGLLHAPFRRVVRVHRDAPHPGGGAHRHRRARACLHAGLAGLAAQQ